jgi:hypothetical protein
MIVVDTSVWIDYFNGNDTPEVDRLDSLLGLVPLAIGDLILTEVLQGFRYDRDCELARQRLLSLTVFGMLGEAKAIQSVEHYRALRQRGVTVRKTADVIIATFCIVENHALLFSDRDFLPFVDQFGLRSAMAFE